MPSSKSLHMTCAESFLRDILIPQLASASDLDKFVFIKLIENHKTDFCSQHNVLNNTDFSIVQELDRLLFRLTLLDADQPANNVKQLDHAYQFLINMLETYPEDLYEL